MANQNKNPRLQAEGVYMKRPQNNFTRNNKLDRAFIERLAPHYYANIFPRLEGKSGWQTVPCIFHEDAKPSLSLSLIHGGFRCHACGVSGDLIRFHMLRQEKNFKQALRDLCVWRQK